MTFFKKARNAAADALRGMKSDYHDESKSHIAIENFMAQTKQLLNENKTQMKPESIEAAQGLIREVTFLLKKDSEMLNNHMPLMQSILISSTLDIIHKYQSKLETSPGFWNQFKASINTLLEQVAGVRDTLSVEKTVHGADNNFQKNKDAIYDIKDEMENGTFSPR